MNILKWLKKLLFEPWNAFVVSFLFGILISLSPLLYKIFNLPEFAQESDNLTYSQLLLGQGIGIFSLLVTVLSMFFSILFTVSLIYYFYRLFFKKKSLKKEKSL